MNNEQRILACLKKVKGQFFSQTSNLISDGWIDSFELIMLINEIEKEFDMRVPIDKIGPESFNSIDRILKIIEISK